MVNFNTELSDVVVLCDADTCKWNEDGECMINTVNLSVQMEDPDLPGVEMICLSYEVEEDV